jgi:hypothetical protein
MKVLEKPVHFADTVMREPGDDYYYEEAIVPIQLYATSQPTTNIQTINLYFTKRGRQVCMSVPHLRFGSDAVPAFFLQCNAEEVPTRFRPAMSKDTQYRDWQHTCVTRSEPQGDNIGILKFKRNGSLEFFYGKNDELFPQGAGSTSSANVYSCSFVYDAVSALNTGIDN